MTAAYQTLAYGSVVPKTGAVLRRSDGRIIPFDPGDGNYIAYRIWLAMGNVPDPVDPLPSTPVDPPPQNQAAQLAARIEFRARALERSGQLLAAYALRNGLNLPA